ncbi:MAG TPA: alpha/beta hydrolase [Nitrospirota bacterium]|nr:alpha/beta hydrolase [Nitrospirota bacterium]
MQHKSSIAWRIVLCISVGVSLGSYQAALGNVAERVVDIPTRSGVTQRFLYLSPENPKAAVILFPGGHGGLQLSQNGSLRWGAGNFVVRTRREFAERGLSVAVIDAPSDRQGPPFFGGFRQRAEHVEDVKAVIAWMRKQSNVPVWLVGTSRGTQSAAFIATQLSLNNGGPDGLVLASAILSDDKGRPVPEMPLGRISVPVLVVHHEKDGCKHCSYKEIPRLMEKLQGAPRKELISMKGGEDRGDPCEPFAYHGFNGIEKAVVGKVSEWIVTAKE